MEHIIILAILGVMALVLSFAVGVEKGKRLVLTSVPAVTARQAVAQASPLPSEAQAAVPAVSETAAAQDPVTPSGNATVAPASSPQPDEETYTVQVASFKTEQYAQKEAKALSDKISHDIFVMSKGRYSIVCVGKFAEKDKAQLMVSKLRKRYKDCLVRRF